MEGVLLEEHLCRFCSYATYHTSYKAVQILILHDWVLSKESQRLYESIQTSQESLNLETGVEFKPAMSA
jgi:hypothetical protein